MLDCLSWLPFHLIPDSIWQLMSKGLWRTKNGRLYPMWTRTPIGSLELDRLAVRIFFFFFFVIGLLEFDAKSTNQVSPVVHKPFWQMETGAKSKGFRKRHHLVHQFEPPLWTASVKLTPLFAQKLTHCIAPKINVLPWTR